MTETPERAPRSYTTCNAYFGQVEPFLEEWGKTRDHLREVTHDDVLTAMKKHHRHSATLSAVKSLFRFARKYKRVFTDPAVRIKAGSHTATPKTILPLDQAVIDVLVTAVADAPDLRLALTLAAIHAARLKSRRALTLDDIDIGNRHITIAGIPRPLDDLTHRVLLDHLNERRKRWPHASNPHLFINSHTAWTTAPVSKNYLFQRLETRIQGGRVGGRAHRPGRPAGPAGEVPVVPARLLPDHRRGGEVGGSQRARRGRRPGTAARLAPAVRVAAAEVRREVADRLPPPPLQAHPAGVGAVAVVVLQGQRTSARGPADEHQAGGERVPVWAGGGLAIWIAVRAVGGAVHGPSIERAFDRT
jgi:hypothetical protein